MDDPVPLQIAVTYFVGIVIGYFAARLSLGWLLLCSSVGSTILYFMMGIRL